MTFKGKSFNLKITYFKHVSALSPLKYPSLVTRASYLDVSCMFMCQGPVGPPGADGERGVDGSKVKSCIILLVIIVFSFDHRVCL